MERKEGKAYKERKEVPELLTNRTVASRVEFHVQCHYLLGSENKVYTSQGRIQKMRGGCTMMKESEQRVP